MRNFDNFDSYCLNERCLQKSNSFFHYSATNQHVMNSHTYQIIDQKAYSKIFSRQQDLVPSYKDHIAEELQIDIKRISDEISKFLKEKYYRKKVDALLQQIDSLQNNNATDLTQKMKKGNMVLLRQIVSYNNLSQEMTIKEYLSAKILKRYQEFNSQIEEDSQSVKLLINILVSDRQQFSQMLQLAKSIKIQKKQQDFNKIKTKLDQPSHQKLQIHEQSNKKIPKIPKIKKIRKDNIIGRKHKQTKMCLSFSSEQLKQEQSYQNQNQIQIQEKKILIVKQPLTWDKAIQFVEQNHKKIEKIHIFNYRFATKSNIKWIIQQCKNLRVLTFNCAHQFDQSLIDEFSNQQFNNMQTIDLKWQFNSFFNEYHIERYFQSKQWTQFEHTDKITIPVQSLKRILNNNSLCIDNNRDAKRLSTQSKFFENIQTLHFHNCRIGQLLKFKNLTNLRTLDLKSISFKYLQQSFVSIIQSNNNLQKILIMQCTDMENPVKLLRCLQRLNQLTHLSLKPKKGNSNYIKLTPKTIFNLTQLTSLHLFQIEFINLKTKKNSSSLQQIYNLRKLTHFSLYACTPIFSDLFTYLHQDCVQNLILLNVGWTNIDNKISASIAKMTSLQYLNIQNNDIFGDTMIRAFKSYLTIHNSKSKLRYLSVEQRIYMNSCQNLETYKWRFSIENIKALSEYLPYLQYLSVYQCYKLNTYDFAEYQTLKMLLVDAKQEQNLKGRISQNVQIIIAPDL